MRVLVLTLMMSFLSHSAFGAEGPGQRPVLGGQYRIYYKEPNEPGGEYLIGTMKSVENEVGSSRVSFHSWDGLKLVFQEGHVPAGLNPLNNGCYVTNDVGLVEHNLENVLYYQNENEPDEE